MFKRFNQPGKMRVRNAQKALAKDGTRCDSKLEAFGYDTFKDTGLRFEYQKKYVLQEKIKYRDKTILPITLTVDFWFPDLNVIVDTKGFQTEVNVLRWKMLKFHLKMERAILKACPPPLEVDLLLPEIFLPKNRKEVSELALMLKSRVI